MALHPSTRLNDKLVDEMCQLIEAGNYIRVSCAAVGIDKTTFSRWRRQGAALIARHPDLDPEDYLPGEVPEELTEQEWAYVRLVKRLEVSEARSEAFAVVAVRKHFPDQWTAAMTYLERRFPDRWRKRQTVEMGPSTQNTLDEQALIEDPEALRMLHEALEKIAGTIEGTSEEDQPELALLESPEKAD